MAHASALRDDTTTRAPARARAVAIARPIPREEPVTMATFPSSPNGSRVLVCDCDEARVLDVETDWAWLFGEVATERTGGASSTRASAGNIIGNIIAIGGQDCQTISSYIVIRSAVNVARPGTLNGQK